MKMRATSPAFRLPPVLPPLRAARNSGLGVPPETTSQRKYTRAVVRSAPRFTAICRIDKPAAERVVAFYNQRGKAEQFIKEGKNAIKWTRLTPPAMEIGAAAVVRSACLAEAERPGRLGSNY